MTNSKSTKRSLLMSAMSMLLCVSMLLGTTFAWFTDTVTSANNVITSGNLDIAVEYTLDGTTWKPLDGAGDLFQKGLWEPGHTEVVALKIENKGSLALKYNANMNIVSEKIGTNRDGGNIVLSDILTVSTLTFAEAGVDPVFGINIAQKTIEEAFKGENGIGYNSPVTFKSGNILGESTLLKSGAIEYVAVKVDMAETVGNEANAKDKDSVPYITFGINVLATQFTNEDDSFGNQYDKDAKYPVIDAYGLAGALEEGRAVKLEADIILNEAIEVDGDVDVDLNGFNLDASGLDSAFTVANDATITIDADNETIDLGANGLVEVDAGANAVIEINGGNFVSDDAASTLIKPNGDGDIKIILNDVNYKSTAPNGYALDCSYYAGDNLSVEINGGSFEATTGLLLPEGSSVKGTEITVNNTKNMQPAVYAMGDMTIENCIIKADKSHAVAVAGGATLNVIDCKVYAGSDANALAFQVFSSGGTINVTNSTFEGGYGTTGKMKAGCVAIINIDGVEKYRKG